MEFLSLFDHFKNEEVEQVLKWYSKTQMEKMLYSIVFSRDEVDGANWRAKAFKIALATKKKNLSENYGVTKFRFYIETAQNTRFQIKTMIKDFFMLYPTLSEKA